MYNASQTENGALDAFFMHENGIHISSLAACDKKRYCAKADMVTYSFIQLCYLMWINQKQQTRWCFSRQLKQQSQGQSLDQKRRKTTKKN